jgi:hypothetical protein
MGVSTFVDFGSSWSGLDVKASDKNGIFAIVVISGTFYCTTVNSTLTGLARGETAVTIVEAVCCIIQARITVAISQACVVIRTHGPSSRNLPLTSVILALDWFSR